MYTAKVILKPVIKMTELSQKGLRLSDEEMENIEGLTQYIKDYHTPFGFEVLGVSISKDSSDSL